MTFTSVSLGPNTKQFISLLTFVIIGHLLPSGSALAYSHLRQPGGNSEEKTSPWRAREGGPCLFKRCGAGKICQESSGIAHCNCIGECKVRSPRAVCGTDGKFYTSHCELRRTSCLTGEKILFSHYYQHEPHHYSESEDFKDLSWNTSNSNGGKRLHHCSHHNHRYLNRQEKQHENYEGESSEEVYLNPIHPTTQRPHSHHRTQALISGHTNKRRQDLGKISSSPKSRRADVDDGFVVGGEGLKIGNGHLSKDKAHDDSDEDSKNLDGWRKRIEMSDKAFHKEEGLKHRGSRRISKDGHGHWSVDSDDHHHLPNPPVKSSSFSTNTGQSSRKQSWKGSERSTSPSGTSFARVCSPPDYEKLKASIFQLDMAELMKHLNTIIPSAFDDTSVSDDDSSAYQSDTISASSSSDADTPSSEGDGPQADKDNLLRKIFNVLDSNSDGILEYVELYKAEVENKLGLVKSECDWRDFLLFDDTDHDGRLHVNEFFSSFSHFYDITMISLDKALELKYSRVIEGESVHLTCDIRGSPPPYIKWKRYQINVDQLGKSEIKENIDGSLTITNVHMNHGGQYSCQSPRNPEVVQTHIIIVETIPYVTITPKASWKRPGEDFLLSCTLVYPILPDGVKWTWLFNGIGVDELPKLSSGVGSDNNKYILENSSSGGFSRLRIQDIYFQDMGSYSCQAENEAGTGIATASLVVIDPNSKPEVQALHNTNAIQLLVFHRNGLAAYSAENCGWLWEIFGDDDILQKESDTGRSLSVCDQFHGICHWQGGIQVSPNYVYGLQPQLNKLILIDVGALNSVGNALGSVETCRNPERLEYVQSTDQLWIVCEKDISILENASRDPHQSRKIVQFPADESKGMARIYLPVYQARFGGRKECQFGYVQYKEEGEVLRKLDLKTYHETKKLNLTKYGCVPNQVHFYVSCTTIIINCEEKGPNGQLVVDVLSNSVFKTGEIAGSSIQSPDGRILLTEKHVGNTTHVFVQRVGVYDISLLSHFLIESNISNMRIVHSTLTGAYASVAKLESGKEVVLSLQTGELQSVDDLINFVPHSSEVSLYSADNAFPLKTEKSVIVMDAETLRPRCKFYEDIPELQSFLTVRS